ncbi:hypothetical protein B9Z55_008901 [Caenorhabditis nigoni]|uniref:Uncharacterized protein n=1 Tax=Caenorhabditis nigoni TaxID=1611254 RepID=A0A2G5TYV4_9PELO|nr:hypothetical protein B9Z55_012785 [Caenorhabditis nigoni]PIC41507.1 hypothetical protein B9Z55_008901 [Caenorhabditis nigoni]
MKRLRRNKSYHLDILKRMSKARVAEERRSANSKGDEDRNSGNGCSDGCIDFENIDGCIDFEGGFDVNEEFRCEEEQGERRSNGNLYFEETKMNEFKYNDRETGENQSKKAHILQVVQLLHPLNLSLSNLQRVIDSAHIIYKYGVTASEIGYLTDKLYTDYSSPKSTTYCSKCFKELRNAQFCQQKHCEFFKLVNELEDIKFNNLEINNGNERWFVQFKVIISILDLKASRCASGFPNWQNTNGCAYCTIEGIKIGNSAVSFYAPCPYPNRTRHDIALEMKATGHSNNLTMLINPIDNCIDQLHVASEGVVKRLFSDILGNTCFWKDLKMRKSVITEIDLTMRKLKSHASYKSKFVTFSKMGKLSGTQIRQVGAILLDHTTEKIALDGNLSGTSSDSFEKNHRSISIDYVQRSSSCVDMVKKFLVRQALLNGSEETMTSKWLKICLETEVQRNHEISDHKTLCNMSSRIRKDYNPEKLWSRVRYKSMLLSSASWIHSEKEEVTIRLSSTEGPHYGVPQCFFVENNQTYVLLKCLLVTNPALDLYLEASSKGLRNDLLHTLSTVTKCDRLRMIIGFGCFRVFPLSCFQSKSLMVPFRDKKFILDACN